MSEDTTPDLPPNGTSSENPDAPTGGESVAELKQEVERLRVQLARATGEAETYRRAADAMLEQLDPYVRPSEEELRDMVHGPRGRPLLEVIAEAEQGLSAESGVVDGRG